MKSQKGNAKKKNANSGLVAVAVDKDKGSQHALKWAADHLVSKGQSIILLHVILGSSSDSGLSAIIFFFLLLFLSDFSVETKFWGFAVEANAEKHKQAESLFVTFHCYCSRKEVKKGPGFLLCFITIWPYIHVISVVG